jgi:hypothetical protein
MEADRETKRPRWAIVRLIWLRELRDQLRDRRTLFMIAVLPLVLYPALGFAVLQFAPGLQERPSKIGIVRGPGGSSDFPERAPGSVDPAPPPYPPLVAEGRFLLFDSSKAQVLPAETLAELNRQFRIVFLKSDDSRPLDEGEVDLILSAPPDYFTQLAAGDRDDSVAPRLTVRWRPEDDGSRAAPCACNVSARNRFAASRSSSSSPTSARRPATPRTSSTGWCRSSRSCW